MSGLRVLGRVKSGFRSWDLPCRASGSIFTIDGVWDVSFSGFRAPNVGGGRGVGCTGSYLRLIDLCITQL